MIQLKYIFGCFKSKRDKRDFLVSTFVKEVIKKLLTKFSIRDKMTPVRSQGKEGACVGFAGAVGVKEYQEQIDYGRFISLSPRFLYEESKKISKHREGTTLKACAKVLVDKGICEEGFWKYIPKNPQQPLPGAYHNAQKYKVESGYVRITNEKELKASLIKFGATIIGVGVYRNWYRQKNGHIPNATFWDKTKGRLGGHAITLTGYNDETQEYEFKNSWGKSWGNEGYGFLTYQEMRRTLMDAICMIDIDDPNEWQDTPIKTVRDLSFLEKIKVWV